MALEIQLEIVGLLKTTHFHAAKGVAERLTKKFPASFGDPVILHLLESDWHVYTTGKGKLFSDLCPKTCENFKALCTGEAGNSQSQVMLCYKNTLFSRVVPNVWVQGGDENFSVSHNKRGILGMANQGPHTNSSQFYITLQPALWMDRKYVAFGQVVEGTDVLRRLEEVPTYNERPKEDCKIVTCGLFNP